MPEIEQEPVTEEPAAEEPVEQEHLMQFFEYAHLPQFLQEVSMPFAGLANRIVENLPRNPERTVALRKLLEAKGRNHASKTPVIV